ncbi:Hypothetical Protein FCC1311_052772 [Hondaea fermentalgiana]|uniref:Uncharacterized protein n=1 Tax=Hondaea fermentalgiana TaxID=2315210 RepID=A0A2R5GER6_9STRA|nr:Hypothetical Protein FCC1311_052772 [Hondaea fermentalgiana]|eukprot:GBG29055.1 Hypothetical Protein FCC1311_052772 [Hondaea fermentalgiana]
MGTIPASKTDFGQIFMDQAGEKEVMVRTPLPSQHSRPIFHRALQTRVDDENERREVSTRVPARARSPKKT